MGYGLAGIFALAALAFGIRLWHYRQQINYLLSQIELLEQEDTNYRLSSYCRVGKTEQLICELNRVIQLDRDRMMTLKKGNRSYRESIISISHDIRTPLTSAKGYIQMLLKEKKADAEKQRAYMENIERRIDDVTDMLTQLFEYARIEADEFVFHMERLNLCNLMADTLSMFYEDFAGAGCEPVVRISGLPCYVCADRHGVKRILENLIRNALVHGTGDYFFSLEKRKNTVEITVSNRTDSIKEEDMERIFDRFYTTDQSRTRKTTGLGLAIVKRFTEKMGGSVSARLQEDNFSVTVSFAADQDIVPHIALQNQQEA